MPLSKKRFLPHINAIGYFQFVTFRTNDSVDHFVLKLRQQDINESQKEYLIDRYTDVSRKGAYLNGEVLDFLKSYLIEQDKKLYSLIAFCIMPNHVHIAFRQDIPLSDIMRRIKGATSYHINRLLQKEGRFWEENYFDRIIRDDKHFAIVYDYIKNNPIKAGLKDYDNRFYSSYE